jgi:hypothetical protein
MIKLCNGVPLLCGSYKAFSFSMKVDESELRFEERRKGFVGNIFLGIHCSIWLKDTVEEAMKDPGKKYFVKSFREDVKVLMVRGGGNKVGRYLEVGAFAEEGHKAVIWLPEGYQGWGWSRVVAELQQMLEFLEAKDRLLMPMVSTPEGIQKGMEHLSGPSFAEVLCSAAGDDGKVVGMKSLTAIPLDLLPKADCNELANGGEEVRSSLNCFEYESWSYGSAAATSCATMKKQATIVTKGSFVNRCLKKLLGLCRFGLDRAYVIWVS